MKDASFSISKLMGSGAYRSSRRTGGCVTTASGWSHRGGGDGAGARGGPMRARPRRGGGGTSYVIGGGEARGEELEEVGATVIIRGSGAG
jgi:hypothetical protein